MTSTAAGTDSAAVDFVRFVYQDDRAADWGDGWLPESEEHYREHGPLFRARMVAPGAYAGDPDGGLLPLDGRAFVMDSQRQEQEPIDGWAWVHIDGVGDSLQPMEYVALGWDEYRRTYGNPDHWVTLGAVGLRRCECCGAARVVDSVWGFDYYTGPVPAGCDPGDELPDAVAWSEVEKRGREYGQEDMGWAATHFEWRD